MEKIIIDSPAKINLGLNVIRKRDDGYHDLETIFVPISLSDKIILNQSSELKFQTNSDLLNRLGNNLILNAIQLLEENSGKKITLNIFVEKKIPIGGGLGGGSSNAASTLKAVNKMLDLGLNFQKLSELALQLGSDVPFFLNPVPSYAESRGETLYPLKKEINYPVLIVNPGIKIDTAWAFNKVKPIKPAKNLRSVLDDGIFDFDEIRRWIKNDFEGIVFKSFPEIKRIKEDLYDLGAEFALLSGTGSTVYGIFTNLQKAFWAEENFRQKYFTYLHNPFLKGSIT